MQQEERNFIAHFGGCPECGGNEGWVNIGRSHWMFCKRHKLTWSVGSNLFSSWRGQTEEEQRKIYDQVGMSSFNEITPEQAHTHPLVRKWMSDLEQQTMSIGSAITHSPCHAGSQGVQTESVLLSLNSIIGNIGAP
jgi:hypothetical protein